MLFNFCVMSYSMRTCFLLRKKKSASRNIQSIYSTEYRRGGRKNLFTIMMLKLNISCVFFFVCLFFSCVHMAPALWPFIVHYQSAGLKKLTGVDIFINFFVLSFCIKPTLSYHRMLTYTFTYFSTLMETYSLNKESKLFCLVAVLWELDFYACTYFFIFKTTTCFTFQKYLKSNVLTLTF